MEFAILFGAIWVGTFIGVAMLYIADAIRQLARAVEEAPCSHFGVSTEVDKCEP